MREKKRYVVFKVQQQTPKEEVFLSLESALKEFLGILGLSHVNPEIMKDKFKNKQGIIRINHSFKDEVISALALSKVKVDVMGVSGILKKAEAKFMEG